MNNTNGWTKEKYLDHCRTTSKELGGEEVPEDVFQDYAQGALWSDPILREFIQREFGASNPVERFAEDLFEHSSQLI